MSRYALKYSEADMLDAYWAGRNHVTEGVKPSGDYLGTGFFDWIEEKKRIKRLDQEAKELKDDEMRAEAQADGEQYERELDEANQI